MKWYAKLDNNTVIATGNSYTQCSNNALATGIWKDKDNPQGSVAPYYITTIAPEEIDI